MGNVFQKMMPTATKIVQQMQQNNNQQQQPAQPQQPQNNVGTQPAAPQPQTPAPAQPQNVVTPAPTPTPAPAPVAPAPAQPQRQMPIINTSDPLSGMNAVLSLADEEQERKKSLLSQRILALGDAFRQIGNIHNAVNGAPAQQFNNPVLEERQRYQQEKAVRDNDRYKQMAMRQSQKMNELKAKQMEDENEYRKSSIAMRKAEHDRLMGRQKLDERKQAFYEDLKKQQFELDKAYKEHKMSYEDYVAQSGRINAQANWMRAEKYQPGGSSAVGEYETVTETSHYPEVIDETTGEVKKWGSRTKRTRTAKGGKKSLPNAGGTTSGKKKLPNA